MDNLQQEFDFFLEHKEEYLAEHFGKYIVIKNRQVLGVYDDILDAINTTKQTEELGSFIVQLCDLDSTATQMFHSRVSFAR